MFIVFVTTYSEDQDKSMQASPQNHKLMTITACSLIYCATQHSGQNSFLSVHIITSLKVESN